MRHRAKGRQLSRTSSHRRALLNNMAASLFEHGRIITTEAKAKELRPVRREADHAGAAGRPARPPAGRAEDQGPRDPVAAVQRDRSAVRRAARRLHPHPQAGPPRGRRRRHRPDRAAVRVSRSPARPKCERGPWGPLFLDCVATAIAPRSGRGDSRLGRLRDPVTLDALGADPHPPGRAVDRAPGRSAGSDTSAAWSGCWRGSRCCR